MAAAATQEEIDSLRARIIEHSPVMIAVVRAPDFVYELVNPAFRALAPGKEFLGRRFADVWPDGSGPLVKVLQQVLDSGTAIRFEDAPYPVPLPSGAPPDPVHVAHCWIPLPGSGGKPGRVLTLGYDTTGRLAESEAILRSFFDSAGVLRGVVELVDGRIRHVSCNQSAAALYGLTPESIAGQFASDTGASAELEPRWVALYEESRRTGRPVSMEYARRDPEGRDRWLLATASFIGPGPAEHPRYAYTIFDLTDRKRMEEALREREEHFRTLSETMLQGVVYQDANGRILSMNPAAEAILGKTPREFLGETSESVAHDCIREDGTAFPGGEHPAMVALATGREVRGIRMGIYNPKRGHYRWIDISAVPLFRAGETKPHQVYTIFSDITESRMAETALRDSESRLRTLTDNLPEGAIFRCRIDPHGRPLLDFISAGIERLTGVSAAECMADPAALERSILPNDRERLRAAFRHSRDQLTRFEVEVRHTHRATGEVRWSLLRSTPARQPDGSVVWDGIELDITGRKEMETALRQSEKRYRLLHESLRDAFVRVSMDGRILEFNDVFCRMLGYQAEEMRGLTDLDLTPPRWRAFEDNILWSQILPRGYSSVYEKEYRRKDGSLIPVELRTILSRDADGQPAAMWAIVRDITDRRVAEQALRESRAELETRNREVERVNRMKTEFLARSSHELRTPLNAIVGYADLLAEQAAGPLPPPYPRYVANIQEGARHLLDMVNDLLDISRIEAGRIELHIERFDVPAALEEVLSVITPLADIKGVALDNRLSPGTLVAADRVRFKQILYNLLSNAVKFTPEDGTVWIEASTSGEQLVVCVGDTGIGIPPGEMDAIFEEFHQVSSARKPSAAGVGLGLAITRKLARLLGGDVRVQSKVGQGSRFLVTLPAAGMPVSPAEREAHAEGPGG